MNTISPTPVTYTAEDLMLSGTTFPFTAETTHEDLTDAAWLGVAAAWMIRAYGVDREGAFDNLVENQTLALAGRAAGLLPTEVADQGMLNHPGL